MIDIEKLRQGYPVRNKKTGNTYIFLDVIINTTNTQHGQKMVLYRTENGMEFVRDLSEFCEKFELKVTE